MKGAGKLLINHATGVIPRKQAAYFLAVTVQTVKNYLSPGKFKSSEVPASRNRALISDLEDLAPARCNPSGDEPLEQSDRLYLDYVDTIGALLNTLDTRDGIAPGHSRRVANYAVVIGGGMGLPSTSMRTLELAALLHDVGKIMIDEQILGKPGELTDQEAQIIRQHPVIGESIVGAVESLGDIMPFIRHHHERFDGMGYPDGLKEETIPLEARIIFIAEAFDCLTSDTSYRPSRHLEEVLGEMERGSETQFDPRILGVFMDNLS